MVKIIKLVSNFSKKTNKTTELSDRIKILKEMKPYFLPFLHANKNITKALVKSYIYLVVSKICFFGGPLMLKKGINTIHSGTLIDPLLLFLGYGVCYSF